jgi:adenosylmethionine-8-amino-7-oxononanoate aminotransferase|tara:strand:- start:20953 stop:22227 length:1275 start_codon:yes stop_codon:yes gene_type:complete
VSEKRKSNVWPPFTQMKTAKDPLNIVKAHKTILTDSNGKNYIDANSSWWVNVHGHGHPYLAQAIQDQFEKVDHVLLAGATHPKVEELAERIIKILPDHFEKVFFSDDGSTAIEVALKMVFQYWHNKEIPKRRIVALNGAYHGDTFGAMSIGQRGYFNEPFEHLFFDVDYLEFPTKENEKNILDDAKKLFETKEIAGLIVEPLVQGAAGMRMYSVKFLDALVQLAKENDVLVIYDEIMTGWYRTGKFFAMNHGVSKPDIVCLSKGLTGGVLPLGLTVATQEIYDAFLDEKTTKALLHGHSYTGNPLSCAASCASLDLFAQQETKENVARIVKQHADFKSKIERRPELLEVRQQGTIIAFELKTDSESSYFSTIRDRAYYYFIENGILMRPLGNVLFLNPPYCITDDELAYCYKKIEDFLTELTLN